MLYAKPKLVHLLHLLFVQTLHLTVVFYCKIHIDPFTINTNDGAGAKLQLFMLQANGQTIYDFRTDISNPPSNAYVPSLVALDPHSNRYPDPYLNQHTYCHAAIRVSPQSTALKA